MTKEIVALHIENIVDCWAAVSDDQMLQDFLHKLKAKNDDFHEYALGYLDQA